MTQLTNQSIQQTYGDLITCTNGGQGLTDVLSIIQDGLGNNSPLQLATTAFNINRGVGSFLLDGSAMTATSVNINSMCQENPVALGNAALKLPVGNTAQRPTPVVGDIRYNTDINNIELWNSSTWIIAGGASVATVTGTADQIIVSEPNPAPVISLANNIKNIDSIDFGELQINVNPYKINTTGGIGLAIEAGSILDLNAGAFIGVNADLIIRPTHRLSFTDPTNTFNTTIKSGTATESATYDLPVAYPIGDGFALTSTTFGIMSWEQVQLRKYDVVVPGGISMTTNSQYIVNVSGTVITLTLPTVSAANDTIVIVGAYTGAGWIIAQNANQAIHFVNSDTTTGVTGSVASTSPRNSITLVCMIANTDWMVISNTGNLTVT